MGSGIIRRIDVDGERIDWLLTIDDSSIVCEPAAFSADAPFVNGAMLSVLTALPLTGKYGLIGPGPEEATQHTFTKDVLIEN